MDPFIKYLEKAKQFESTIDSEKTSQIHIVLGNESCDLDSMVSALALSYFYSQTESPIVIPVLNIPAEEFSLRTENCYVLEKLGINKDLLVFRDNLNLKGIQSRGLLSVSLVDHHVLRPDDSFLAASVIEIFDHRPRDSNAAWDKNKVEIVIQEVGSCSTLVAHKLFSNEDLIISNSLATLLYYVITFDTVAYSPEVGKVKELDITISNKLLEQLDLNEDAKAVFEELWTAHHDVSHLTPKQLLLKDLKIVEGLPVPVLPMLVEEFLKFPNVGKEMESFSKQRNSSTIVIIGLNVVQNYVSRDIAVYSHNNDDNLVNAITSALKDALKSKGYDLGLQEVVVDIPNVKYFKQNNIKLTRKHILPLIKDTIVIHKGELKTK